MATTRLQGLLETEDFEHIGFTKDLEAANSQSQENSWRPNKLLKTQLGAFKSPLSLRSIWQRPKNLHKTAYLDGLRGFAAFLVYWHHHVLWVHNADRLAQNSIFENGFGYDNKYYFATFPGIRLFFCGGHFAVSTFFVISGYVLSLKPLKLIEEGDPAALVQNIGSAIFRRWLRLFLPILITMLLYASSWHFFHLWVDGASPQGNWRDEMWFFYCEFKNFSFIFKEGGVPWFSYNMHLWSIPMEMKGSMVIFASLLAFSSCTVVARLWCQIVLMSYFMYIADGWYCAMFVSGMFLADLSLLNNLEKLPRLLSGLRPYKTVICYHALVVSIYLGGVPCENRDVDQLGRNRGWYLLSFLKPQAAFDYKWFYLFWAATLLVGSISSIKWLKGFFETRPCQYLGRVSFALYMVHGPLLWTLGDRLYTAVGIKGIAQAEHIPQWIDRFVLPLSGPLGLEFAFLMPHLIILPITLFAAHFITLAVDKPSVKFAAWVYRVTLPSTTKKLSKA